MEIPLRTALRETLRGWQEDIEFRWRNLVDDVALAFDEIDGGLELEPWEPIFPARRERAFPGAPSRAHMFRAFDDLIPDNVRCVVLGQDPYPCPAIATGRAFEAGNVACWRELDKMFSPGVRTFIQLTLAARTGDDRHGECAGRWPMTLAAIERREDYLEDPAALADRWVSSGALLLNTSLTITRSQRCGDPHLTCGHPPLWRPLILRILGHLAQRDTPTVFIGFGDAAANVLAMAGLGCPVSDGQGAVTVRPHPALADEVLVHSNPFLLCNQRLRAMGGRPVDW